VTWLRIATTAIGLLALGCGARIGDSDQDNGFRTDASSGGGNVDAANGSSSDASNAQPDAGNVACPNNRKVYLEFNGVTLTQAATSNALTNLASWINNGTSQIPSWRPNSGTRAQDIANVIAGVKSRLANTPIEVVMTKPTTGPFVMIVFGGARTADGGSVGTPWSGATNEHDCGDVVKSDIGWVAENVSIANAQDFAVGAIGWGLGLNGTTDPNGCMCNWANTCQSAAGACTLSASIASTTSLAPGTTCPNQNPQNEVAAFSTKFCQ
jgi:hypothetical protein